ncbi:MAG: hypothetical protein LBG25_04200 [Spirochaetaceae bacterium]|jgi:hypothetical protein|nr:hypothetical protein [Spirochaetaceae bacterium]
MVFVGTTGKFQPDTGGVFSYGQNGYKVSGLVNLINNLTADAGQVIAVTGTGILNITGKKLTLDNTPVTGEDGARIVIGAGGSIALGASDSNYYEAGTAAAETGPINTVATYTWKAAAGGSTNDGWERPK